MKLLILKSGFAKFGTFLKRLSNSQHDTRFIDGFITATLTVSVGAMAILGPINDVLLNDLTILYAKSLLDCVIVIVISSTFGKGAIFSAIPVAIIQGGMTILALFLQGSLNESMLHIISLIGNAIILCVGLNLVRPQLIRVSNTLPAIIVGMLLSFVIPL